MRARAAEYLVRHLWCMDFGEAPWLEQGVIIIACQGCSE